MGGGIVGASEPVQVRRKPRHQRAESRLLPIYERGVQRPFVRDDSSRTNPRVLAFGDHGGPEMYDRQLHRGYL